MSTGIAVVIVAHDSAPHVERLLKDLRPDPSSRPLTRVVVDNGSSDDLAARLSAYPDVRLVTQVNTGFAHGINRGVEAAPRDAHVLVLNPDVRIGVADVEALAEVLDRDAATGVVVPALVDDDARSSRSLRRDPTVLSTLSETLVGGTRAGSFGEAYQLTSAVGPTPVEWATGAVMLLRRSVFDQLGGFDESFFLYSEETDYCMRVRDAGYRVVVRPRVEVTHLGGEMATRPDLWALRAVNRVRLHRRRHGAVRGMLFRLATLLFELRRLATGDRVSRAAVRELLRPSLDASAKALRTRLGGVSPREHDAAASRRDLPEAGHQEGGAGSTTRSHEPT
jgi:N-acetylglucosaminyl-diphospho-decaprenol L-rhamnosyltransferase